jgi:tRNA pseudouridine32 synthase/23S rRNA pseudouridine746 synthase
LALLHYQPPCEPYLAILHQDDHILVLNKPSGLLSVPGKAPDHKDSLQWRVCQVYPTASIVHRLDMATSGIMLMALNKAAHRHLSRQFETRQIHKRYLARVSGRLDAFSGEISLPMRCDWPNRPLQKICFDTGKSAITR